MRETWKCCLTRLFLEVFCQNSRSYEVNDTHQVSKEKDIEQCPGHNLTLSDPMVRLNSSNKFCYTCIDRG